MYERTQWKDEIIGVRLGTPVDAKNLNHIEEALEDFYIGYLLMQQHRTKTPSSSTEISDADSISESLNALMRTVSRLEKELSNKIGSISYNGHVLPVVGDQAVFKQEDEEYTYDEAMRMLKW